MDQNHQTHAPILSYNSQASQQQYLQIQSQQHRTNNHQQMEARPMQQTQSNQTDAWWRSCNENRRKRKNIQENTNNVEIKDNQENNSEEFLQDKEYLFIELIKVDAQTCHEIKAEYMKSFKELTWEVQAEMQVKNEKEIESIVIAVKLHEASELDSPMKESIKLIGNERLCIIQ